MILLDTSVLIEYFRKQKKEKSFFYQLAGRNEALAISSITKYEILVGKRKGEESFWEGMFSNLTVFPFGDSKAELAASIQQDLLKKNQTIGFGDLAIGTTAKLHSLELATLNLKHFERIPDLSLIRQR